jgi:hypothetical protein
MAANEMAIFQNHPARSCFALKQCYQTVLSNSARKQRCQAVLASNGFVPKTRFVYNRLRFFFCNQLFGREFWCPIARSSSCALDRRRHP